MGADLGLTDYIKVRARFIASEMLLSEMGSLNTSLMVKRATSVVMIQRPMISVWPSAGSTRPWEFRHHMNPKHCTPHPKTRKSRAFRSVGSGSVGISLPVVGILKALRLSKVSVECHSSSFPHDVVSVRQLG